MECDTFSCVIKSRVTRTLYIIHAVTRRRPPHSQSRILILFILSLSSSHVYSHLTHSLTQTYTYTPTHACIYTSFIYFHTVLCSIPYTPRTYILLFVFPPISFFLSTVYTAGLISRGWNARSANILHRMPRTNMRGNFIGPTRSACAIFTVAIARPFPQLLPSSVIKLNFPESCSWLRANADWLSFDLLMLAGALIIQPARAM